MPKQVQLNASEIAALMEQDPSKEGDGGWQSLLVKFQKKIDPNTGALTLDDAELERIPRFAFDYGKGGWETQLKRIFGRVLGDNLGR